MPRITDDNREAHMARIRERKIYCAKHYSEVLPGAREKEITKAQVFRRLVESAAANGLADHPYFKGSARRLLIYVKSHFGGASGIRQIAMDEYGCCTAYGQGLKGIKRAGKKLAEGTAKWHANVLSASAEVQQLYADSARKLLDAAAPSVQLRLFQP